MVIGVIERSPQLTYAKKNILPDTTDSGITIHGEFVFLMGRNEELVLNKMIPRGLPLRIINLRK